MKTFLHKIIRKLRLLWNRHRMWIQFQRKGVFFTLVLNERFRVFIKWFKYILSAIGILSALIVFANVIYALLFGVGLFIIQTLVEKTVFSYHVLMVMPLPDFVIDGEKWLGVLSGYAQAPNGRIPMLGMVFNNEQYAQQFYRYIVKWSHGEHRDKDNDIIVSIITNEAVDKYVFYLYANPDGKVSQQLFAESEQARKNSAETFTDILVKNYMLLTLGKTCIISPESYLPTLLKTYKDGILYTFAFYHTKAKIPGGESPVKARQTQDIIKYHLKIRKESELTRNDFEYELTRDWNPPDAEFQGPQELLKRMDNERR